MPFEFFSPPWLSPWLLLLLLLQAETDERAGSHGTQAAATAAKAKQQLDSLQV
jgi:hypothetical protein